MSVAAWRARSVALHQRVARFIAGSLSGDESEPFDALACDIARHQHGGIEPLQRLYASARVEPQELTRSDLIPALPCQAFRHRRIAVHPAELDERCFASSGTTAGAELRSLHPMRTTASYRTAALAWAGLMLWPDDRPLELVALVEPEQRAPHSSLSFMLARFAEHLGRGASWHLGPRALDVAGVRRACEAAADAGRAVLVAGTSFAFVHLLDALDGRPLHLAEASRVMQTGGFKGRSREVEPAALSEALAQLFGLPQHAVIGEYGMTELSSQGYQVGLRAALAGQLAPPAPQAYRLPPWVRARAVDPSTLAPLEDGREGLCRLVDLANVDSAVAVQTSDRVRVGAIGAAAGAVELLGRQPGAPPRGCSLALEPLLENR